MEQGFIESADCMESAEVSSSAAEPVGFAEPHVLHGAGGDLLYVLTSDGWRGGYQAHVPLEEMNAPPLHADVPYPTREEAVLAAADRLIDACSIVKSAGSKKRRLAAEQLQDWALGLVARTKSAVAIAEAPASEKPSDPEAAAAPAEGPAPAQSSPAAAADLPIQLIPIDQLYESPWNPRQYYPEAAMEELIESMRQSGFREWLPLLVRPLGEASEVWRSVGQQGGYEIGAGHRRSRAARAAGIQMIPCIVRAMSDAEFLDVLNFDNSGREDVHPLHEAAGWRAWMEKTGKGVADIAARIGQGIGYVYKRLKYASLIEEASKAFLDGKISGEHAIFLARQQPDVQKKALKFCITHDWKGHGPSSRDLAKWLHEQAYVDLRDAAFDLSDPNLLAGAGACGGCPKRAANIPGFEFEKEDSEANLCTDRKCHQQKLDNHLFRIRADVQAKHGTVLTVSQQYSTKQKGAHNASEWEKAKADDKNAKKALVVEGPDLGKVITVKLRPSRPASPRVSQEEQEAARKKHEEAVAREMTIRRAILHAVTAKVDGLTDLGRADIQALVGVLVEEKQGYGTDSFSLEELCKLAGIQCEKFRVHLALKAALPKLSDQMLARLVVASAAMSDFCAWRIRPSEPEPPEALLALAKRYKVDAAKIRREMEDAAKEAEGGTRKEVVAKRPVLGSAAAKKAAPKKAKPAAKKSAAKKKGGKK